jgi:superfamily II DNA or RNA helicase
MEQNVAYTKLMEKARQLKEMGKQAELLVADLRYRQHAELLKVRTLAEMAQEYMYEGKSVVIFVNFRETMRYLAEALNTKSLIFGDQERFGIDRDKVVDDFQAGAERIIICMVEAGGQSISLHDTIGGSQRISLICPTYNPISLQQILGRTYRAGSKTIPIMKLVYAAGTVEEKVAETVNRKLDNIAALNDGDLMETDLFHLERKEKI